MELELIDGNPVVSHVVRFKDRVTITDRDAQAVRDGAVIVWVIRTVCQPPSYHPTEKDSEDRYRFNIQNVKAAAVLHDELRDGALAYLDDPTQNQGRFVFDSPRYPDDDQDAPIEFQSTAFLETGTTFPPLPTYDEDHPGPHVIGSVYSPAGSDAHRLLEQWDEL